MDEGIGRGLGTEGLDTEEGEEGLEGGEMVCGEGELVWSQACQVEERELEEAEKEEKEI